MDVPMHLIVVIISQMHTYIKTSSCTSLYPILICLLSLSKDKEKNRLTEEKKHKKTNLKEKRNLNFYSYLRTTAFFRARSNTSMIQLMDYKATIPSFFLFSSFAPKPPKCFFFFSLYISQDQLPHYILTLHYIQ